MQQMARSNGGNSNMEADAELERWVDLLNSMRVFHDAHSKITVEGVKAVRAELQKLANVALKYGANPKEVMDNAIGTTIAGMKQGVAEMFAKAKTGEFAGKPASIGRLSADGKAYLEKLSGLKFKDFVDFVLNPSDLNHIRSDHYGENEKDKGNNVPLTDEDIKNMVDVLNQPDGILYGVDKKDGRKLFFFLKDAGNGLYNLAEVCSTKKGNLTAKSFFKSKKKGISQRVMEIKDSLLPTSVTYSGEFLSSDAKIPTLFEINKSSSGNVADDGIKLSLGDGGSREREQMDEAKMVERVKATGESLGGAEAHVYTSFADVPEEYKKEVEKGARGWYDPETHTVHVYLPNCGSGDEAQRTVFHESRLSFLFV